MSLDILSNSGFVWAFYDLLPVCHTQNEAFEIVNKTVHSINGKYRFKSLNEFKKWMYQDYY